MYKLKVFICSPFQGQEANIEKAKGYAKQVIDLGCVPFAPHLMFPQMLDDNNQDERNLGIDLGLTYLKCCDLLVLFGDKITEGMHKELEFCMQHKIPVLTNIDHLEMMVKFKIEAENKPKDFSHIFTRDEIRKMDTDTFQMYEKIIFNQLAQGLIK